MTQVTLNAQIRLNGQDEPLRATTLAALLDEKAVDVGQKGIAVALNGAVVPRAEWPATPLKAGDSVEIVRARQGG
jgi:sulfur carrier protein